jgi:hypothetical protein
MSMAEMRKRLSALEKTVNELRLHIAEGGNGRRRWWVDDAGRFKHDALFDEIVRLGREYRESLRPGKQA